MHTWFKPLNPHTQPGKEVPLLCPVYRWGKQGDEGLVHRAGKSPPRQAVFKASRDHHSGQCCQQKWSTADFVSYSLYISCRNMVLIFSWALLLFPRVTATTGISVTESQPCHLWYPSSLMHSKGPPPWSLWAMFCLCLPRSPTSLLVGFGCFFFLNMLCIRSPCSVTIQN